MTKMVSTEGAESDLHTLIRSMNPLLHDDVYVFATVDQCYQYEKLRPVLVFQEREGTTLIVSEKHAHASNMVYQFRCRMITLNVHSALDAIGFLARITKALASEAIGVNTVSAYYHDHLFVPVDRAEDAMQVLGRLASAGD